MPTTILQPTANTSPDPGQGGSAVTGPTNTGHDSTSLVSGLIPGASRSCLWSGFANVGGARTSVVLSLTYSGGGDVSSGADAQNSYSLQYSIDGGSNWIGIFAQGGIEGEFGASPNIALSTGQDLSLVRVRDRLFAAGNAAGGGGAGSVNASVSAIQIEAVTLVLAQVVVIM